MMISIKILVRGILCDVDGEKYITKGESDPKKLFLVIWLILIL